MAHEPHHPAWDWLTENRSELTAITRKLAAEAIRHKVSSRRWVDELVADIDDDALNPGLPAVLGLAVAEIRTSRSVVELTTTHGVHRALLAADALRCAYSGALARSPRTGKIRTHWQSAPPPADVAVLAEEIARRREHHGDARRDRIPSPDAVAPIDLLRFLREAPSSSRVVRAHDHLAGVRLCNALWWQDRSDELYAIQSGLHIGQRKDVLRRQMGSSYAISRGQGVQDRADRLSQLMERGKPDEKGARARRGTQAAPLAREGGWIASQQGKLGRLAQRLVESIAGIEISEDDRYWLDLLADEDVFTSESLVTFAFAADEAQQVLETVGDDSGELARVIAEVDALPGVRRIRTAVQDGLVPD